jgi:hypothetical protein
MTRLILAASIASNCDSISLTVTAQSLHTLSINISLGPACSAHAGLHVVRVDGSELLLLRAEQRNQQTLDFPASAAHRTALRQELSLRRVTEHRTSEICAPRPFKCLGFFAPRCFRRVSIVFEIPVPLSRRDRRQLCWDTCLVTFSK